MERNVSRGVGGKEVGGQGQAGNRVHHTCRARREG